MSYRHLRTLHLALTLIAGLPLLVLSLTGALLVFGPETDRWLEADVRTVAPPAAEAGGEAQALPYSVLLAAIAEQKPELRAWSMGPGKAPHHAWSVWLADGAGYLLIDPYRAVVLDHQGAKESFYGTVTAIHRWWLVDGPARPWVRHAISAAALLLVVQVLVGLWLYLWPPKRLKRLALKRGRVGVLRLHQLTGLLSGLVLIFIALTGMAIHWHKEMRQVVEWVGGPIREPAKPTFGDLPPVRDVDAAVALGRQVMPQARLLHFRVPDGTGAPLSMALAEAELQVPSRVWVGGEPLRVLAVDDRRDSNTTEWIWHFRYHLHYGEVLGLWLRLVWVPMSLLPAAFLGTGIWLWLRRRPGRRRRAPELPGRGRPASGPAASSSWGA